MTSLARACFRWRYAVLGGWIAALVTLAALVLGVGTAFSDDPGMPGSESGTAYSLLARSGSGAGTESGTVVWRAGTAGVTAMLDQVAAAAGVVAVSKPVTNNGVAYATVTLKAGADPAAAEAAARTAGVELGGPAFTE
ncbi:hypothetical protein [Actinoplanes sp. NPDC026619]|uniref:hypothetical protein n=1 Tax=Actinoplanes sp. NPDC026619 TaxID=3155798 RepID=UPI0033ED8F9F